LHANHRFSQRRFGPLYSLSEITRSPATTPRALSWLSRSRWNI